MKSEQRIQDEIRVALSSKDSFITRCNAGKFWQGKRVWSNEFRQHILINLRPVMGHEKGFSDLLYIGKEKVAFIEVKNEKGIEREAQELFRKRVTDLGHRAGVARSVEEAQEIIDG